MSKPTSIPFNKLFSCSDLEFSQQTQNGEETKSVLLKLRRLLKNRDSGTLLISVVQTTDPLKEPVITRTFTSMWCRINEDKYAIVDDDVSHTHDINIFARALIDISSPFPVNDYLIGPDVFNVVSITSRKWSGREMTPVDDPECVAWSNTVIRDVLNELAVIAESEEYKSILAPPAPKAPKKTKAAAKNAALAEPTLDEPTLAESTVVPKAKAAAKSKAKKNAPAVAGETAEIEPDV